MDEHEFIHYYSDGLAVCEEPHPEVYTYLVKFEVNFDDLVARCATVGINNDIIECKTVYKLLYPPPSGIYMFKKSTHLQENEGQYVDLIKRIFKNGNRVDDRTGVGTIAVFGERMEFDLTKGFPAVTIKKLAWKSVVSELLWFLEGSSDERRLAEIHYGKPRAELSDKTTIWTANADKQGKELGYVNNNMCKLLGPIYGAQWNNWPTEYTSINQLNVLIEQLQNNPFSRRHILSAWNVAQINSMALPPCHMMAQFSVDTEYTLSCQMYQRSADTFLGVPFNVASYSLLTHILAQICGYKVGKFIHVIGDAHIYLNHIDQCKTMIGNRPFDAPTLLMPEFRTLKEALECKTEDFRLEGYQSHAAISAEMAV